MRAPAPAAWGFRLRAPARPLGAVGHLHRRAGEDQRRERAAVHRPLARGRAGAPAAALLSWAGARVTQDARSASASAGWLW